MSSFLPLLASASLFGIDATDDTDIWDILKPEDAQSLTLQIRLPYDRELERHQFDGKYSRYCNPLICIHANGFNHNVCMLLCHIGPTSDEVKKQCIMIITNATC